MVTRRQALFNLLNSNEYVKRFTPEAIEKIYQEYRDQIGLNKEAISKFSPKGLEAQVEDRIKDHKGFKTPFGSEKENTLEKLLKGTEPEKQQIREAFQAILAPKDYFSSALKIYKNSMDYFQEQLKQIPEDRNITVKSLLEKLYVIEQNGRDALKAQQKEEMAELKDKAPDLAKDIGKLMGVDETDTAELKKIEDQLIKDLETSHEEQLAKFNTAAKENKQIIADAYAKEGKEVAFSKFIEKMAMDLDAAKRQEMLREIGRARREKLDRLGGTPPQRNTSVNVDVQNNTISSLDPNDLNFIISLSGKKINHDKATGMWSVNMSPRILSPFYYLSRHQNPKVDMLTMAQAVKASGFDSITLTINFDDPKTKKERARQAYEAALESGFDPDPLPGQEGEKALKGIVLKDGSGNEIDPKTLFTPAELQSLHSKAKETRDKIKKYEQPQGLDDLENDKDRQIEIKKALNEGRKSRTGPDIEVPDLDQEKRDEAEIQRVLNS
ncbi:coiled coil domain protein [Legionella wadsworthii]|uniref:Coiled coil domain protein n=1 Tax=Legionella wadsworthii TaxID=28088 RepID=A0A378LPK9_9GAMM|nr:coiled coil domain protein [Legionella wadsworthii]